MYLRVDLLWSIVSVAGGGVKSVTQPELLTSLTETVHNIF